MVKSRPRNAICFETPGFEDEVFGSHRSEDMTVRAFGDFEHDVTRRAVSTFRRGGVVTHPTEAVEAARLAR